MKFFIYIAAIGLSALPGTRDKEPDAYSGFNAITLERPSRHIPWGRPLQGGPIRALFIAPHFTMRDAVELAQRLHLEFVTVPIWDAEHIGHDPRRLGRLPANTSADETLARLRSELKRNHDVVILGNVNLSIFPHDVLVALTRNVADGTGLVLTHHRNGAPAYFREFLAALRPVAAPEAITRGAGADFTPEWHGGLDFIKASAFGTGRVVELDYLGPPPQSHFLLPGLTDPFPAEREHFDTYLSVVAKAVRWAAGHEPPVWIDGVEYLGAPEPDEDEIPPDLPDEYVQQMRDATIQQVFRPYQIHLNQPAGRSYRVAAQVRNPGWNRHTTYSYAAPLRKGATSYPIFVFAGPGRHYLDLWLLDEDDVVDWYTEVITVEGWPAFSNLTFSKNSLFASDTLGISLDVRPLYHNPRPCTLYARATDTLGRIVAEAHQTVAAQGGPTQMSIHFADLIANQVKVEVFALEHRGPRITEWELERAAYGYTYLPVHVPAPAHRFRFIARADGSAEYNLRESYRTLAELGIDTIYTPGGREAGFFLGEANLRSLPIVTDFAAAQGQGGVIQQPYVPNPGFFQAEADRLRRAVTPLWGTPPRLISLGHANTLALDDENLIKSCMEEFREFLRAEYASLPALNTAWGARFGSWEHVALEPGRGVAATNTYGPWLDYWRYMDTLFTRVHVRARNAFQDIWPGARTGMTTPTMPALFSGHDWWQLASQLDLLAVPPDPVLVEKVRSYCTADDFCGIYYGETAGGPDSDSARWAPWYAALHQMPSVWLTLAHAGRDVAAPYAALTPDGRPFPWFREMSQTVGELNKGIGAVLARTERKHCGIALYGSKTSTYLNHLEPSFRTSTHFAERTWIRLLEDIGYQYDFVAADQAKKGRLDDYKLVVLPMVRALSDDEVAALRRFADQGGHIIADVAPGQYTDHGMLRERPPLDNLFGVRRNGPVEAGEPVDGWVRLNGKVESVEAAVSGVTPDLSTLAEKGVIGGKAGTAPVWIVRRSGGTVAVLFNHATPWSYACASRSRQDRALLALVRFLLEEMRLDPVAALSVKKRDEFHGECIGFRYDKADLFALLRDPDHGRKIERVTLDLKGRDHVYDMRQAEAVARPERVPARLAQGEAALFAALPYKVTGVKLDVPERVQAGRRLPIRTTVTSKGGLPGEHIVHIDVVPRGGEPIPHYARNLVCPAGKGETFIPLALNERPWVYQIVARDVLTGTTAQADVEIYSSELEVDALSSSAP